MTRWVAGVDGCRGGWIVVMHPLGRPDAARISNLKTFAEVLALQPEPAFVAIDIPIGLAERAGVGGRACDVAARVHLGQRQSSVFSIPSRHAIAQTDYREACRIAAETSDPPRKVSKMTFNIFPKIREADALMTPALQARFRECHPELAFWRLNGQQPLTLPKKIKSQPCAEGLRLRCQLLAAAGYCGDLIERNPFARAVAGPDDVLDACANAATAAAMADGTAVCVPANPPHDAKGLRMEIWG